MPPRPKAKRPPAATLTRVLHIYVSAFVAPSLIFFAGTGAFQTFRIPDKAGAPMTLQKLARLHKDDVYAPKPPRKAPEPGAKPRRPEGPKPAPRPATEALKWFFTLTSIGMILSTLFGLWMGLKAPLRRRWVVGLFLAGAAIPAVLAALT